MPKYAFISLVYEDGVYEGRLIDMRDIPDFEYFKKQLMMDYGKRDRDELYIYNIDRIICKGEKVQYLTLNKDQDIVYVGISYQWE